MQKNKNCDGKWRQQQRRERFDAKWRKNWRSITNCWFMISTLSETKSLKMKVLLDPGSKKTYLSYTVTDFLQLDTISK